MLCNVVIIEVSTSQVDDIVTNCTIVSVCLPQTISTLLPVECPRCANSMQEYDPNHMQIRGKDNLPRLVDHLLWLTLSFSFFECFVGFHSKFLSPSSRKVNL